jgi:Glycosyl transferase family 2
MVRAGPTVEPVRDMTAASQSRTDHEQSDDLDVSIVIPCLNEEASIGGTVREALAAVRANRLRGEVVVVDNGSDDRSAAVAASAGARVVAEPARGYGCAYLAGFRAARGRLVFMGDADATYDFGELPRFLEGIGNGADFVIGSRLRGTIEPGALAFHRRAGNVALTAMLNLLFRAGVSDAHCGQRLITRDALQRMDLRTPGMELASEMVVKAARLGLRIEEIPITYRARSDHSPSKLRAIPDGVRHVAYMLSEASLAVFWSAALALGAIGFVLLFGSGPIWESQVAGTVLVAFAGILAPAGYWLRIHQPGSGARASILPAWVGSRTAVGALGALALAAMIGGSVVAGDASRLRLAADDERFALVLVAAGVALLWSALWAALARRRTVTGATS